ncbi:MAG: Hsp70 family protein [Ruminococcus sp.]|nr:Hsp70 family protein [Ruminococcus sp.]MCM1381794.1 Hsp70 family protein [Muribaculaceae bacterium]MCM1479168.1 Hsp70 family protein [Muribaculaceae bacterium]
MKSGAYYGVDFGTTNTSVYLYNYEEGKGSRETGFGTDGKDLIPFSSCIAISKTNADDFKFGRMVKEKINEYAENYKIITSFKTLLGTGEEIVVNGMRYNGKELTALFLGHVKNTVQSIRPDFAEAIFSIPVNFSANARKDLLEAAETVGIKVKGFISESSSAYISKARDIKAFSKVMVIDFGGGTLDLSILRLNHNQVHEEAVYGVKFGGDDIDNELALRLMPKVYPDTNFDELDSKRKDKLMNEVERMKIEFSMYDDYTITLGGGSKPIDVEYDTFSEIITPIILKNVTDAILKVMEQANVSPENIDAVILAGGSSGLRPFANIILSMFGEEKIIFDDEDNRYQWMVAKGAAVTSAIGCDFRLSDDICILLSDGSTYPIFRKDVNKVGDKSDNLSFSLTTDSFDAHFIFTDSSGENRYAAAFVKAKGFLDEKFEVNAEIGKNQIARITVKNNDIGSEYQEICELNKLKFYYDLNDIEEEKL